MAAKRGETKNNKCFALIVAGALCLCWCASWARAGGVQKNKGNLAQDNWRNATKRTSGSVVPRPKYINYTNGLDYLAIEPSEFKLSLDEESVELIKCVSVTLATAKYTEQLLFDDVAPQTKDDPTWGKRRRLGSIGALQIKPSVGCRQFKCELMPHSQMDEAYNLTIVSGQVGAKLEACTNWGVLRGLETLAQLIFKLSGDLQGFGVSPVEVVDEPRFKHRGFMLDTARHYISMENILSLLEAMAYNKLNVFHWHLVDDQSFAYYSQVYPQLAKLSAFTPSQVYTKSDVQMVVLYAALLGIRVVPELDTPGHSYSMRHIGGLLSECFDPKTGQRNGDFGPVDPTRSTAYKAIDRLLGELASLFVDSHFHAGGDEVEFDCWKSNPDIGRWMAAKNMSGNYEELTNYYIRRLHTMLTKGHKKTMLVWQEVFDLGAKLPQENTVIHVWKYINDKPAYMAELAEVVKSGYNALLSSCWYLNYIDYGQDWVKFYQCDPRESPVNPSQAHQVLGGEICMWTEFVDDTNVISRTWPRASAAAERLWSPAEANNVGEFLHRLEQHRCRLLARGINAEPVNGPGYC